MIKKYKEISDGIGKIYLITNLISGKLYIGYTSWPLNKRWNSHKSKSINPNNKEHKTILNKAIKSYGAENFTIEIIYCSKDLKYCHEIMEDHFINEYNTLDRNFGYNMINGGGYFPILKGKDHPHYGKHFMPKAAGWNKGIPCPEHVKAICSIQNSGKNSPRANNTIYKFYHQIHGEKKCTKFDLMDNFPDLNKKMLNNLILKKNKIYKGWTIIIDENNINNLYEREFKNTKDHTIYKFYHIDGREEICHRIDFQNKYNFNSSNISLLCNRKISSHKGWKIISP